MNNKFGAKLRKSYSGRVTVLTLKIVETSAVRKVTVSSN